MTNKKKKGYVFLGTSIRGRTKVEGEKIAKNVQDIADVLAEEGFEFDSTVLTNTGLYSGSDEKPDVPKKYFEMSKALIESVRPFRPSFDTDLIRYDIAVHRWTVDLIKRSVACIWECSRSYLGAGYEIATALNLGKHCLVLYDRPHANQTVSSMIAGSMSRLLTVKRFDKDYKETIRDFLAKVESGLDRVIRFNVSQELWERIDNAIEEYDFSDRSEYLRFVIESDLKKVRNG